MERTESYNMILQRYIDRMVPKEFVIGGSEFAEREENAGRAVTKINVYACWYVAVDVGRCLNDVFWLWLSIFFQSHVVN
jgi:hypothetical protein